MLFTAYVDFTVVVDVYAEIYYAGKKHGSPTLELEIDVSELKMKVDLPSHLSESIKKLLEEKGGEVYDVDLPETTARAIKKIIRRQLIEKLEVYVDGERKEISYIRDLQFVITK